ncbi:MFS transporter [Luteipulveratus halotolerans]|uniref:MFS transporter n=1 Tax=Luteipulveratus halotolerans TaxID=1631356 RepID=A0A0L6CP43_9MICO|nr:MFS transporter [Luteipulveratus halotolerans]
MSAPDPSYRSLFALPGLTYVVVAFLGRLPLAMAQIGVLLLVAGTTGSYGAGGACAGALAVANAVGAPLWGAWADRVGQRRVVLIQAWSASVAIGALLAVAHTDLPWAYSAGASAVAGFLLPHVGPLARVRWRPITARFGPRAQVRLMRTAFSYEGSADEASFVIGPALVGVVVALSSPVVALAGAAGLLLVFGTWFALHPTARATRTATAHLTGAGRLVTPALVVLCLAQVAIGSVFGSVQTGTSVLATSAGQPGLTGIFHALLGIGSVAAGLAVARIPRHVPLPTRQRWFSLAFLVLSLPLLEVGSLMTLAPALLVLGLSIAPYMITSFTLGEQVTPPSRVSAAMTLLAASGGLGYAAGAALAGGLADHGGHTPAFAVTVAAGVLAVTIAWGGAGLLGRAETATRHRPLVVNTVQP